LLRQSSTTLVLMTHSPVLCEVVLHLLLVTHRFGELREVAHICVCITKRVHIVNQFRKISIGDLFNLGNSLALLL